MVQQPWFSRHGSAAVKAPQCIQAGILATLSQMQGDNAEQFLSEQDIKHWAIR